MCRIVGYADGAADPIDFPIAPKVATDRLLKSVGMKVKIVELSQASMSQVLCRISGSLRIIIFLPDPEPLEMKQDPTVTVEYLESFKEMRHVTF